MSGSFPLPHEPEPMSVRRDGRNAAVPRRRDRSRALAYDKSMNRLRSRGQLGRYLDSFGLTGDGVEIGVHTGRFSEQILQGWNGRKLWLVDPWRHLDDYLDSFNASDSVMERRYRIACRRLEKYGDRVGFIRERSESAVNLFGASSLDFVYIDANHSYKHVLCDLSLWYTKVRPDGLVAGHDYFDAIADEALEPCMFGTFEPELLSSYGGKSAVDEFAAGLGIRPKHTGEKYPTWYFKKPS